MGESEGRRAYGAVHLTSGYAASIPVSWATSKLDECVAPAGRPKRAREEEEKGADNALCGGGSGPALKVLGGQEGRTSWWVGIDDFNIQYSIFNHSTVAGAWGR